jgi:membrane protease YdiL (CAAX protease family)
LIHYPLQIYTVDLPLQRPFQWRVFFTLVALYFVGNLAGVPLLRATQAPIEPLWFWGVATLISAVILGLSMLLTNRIGLGAPFLEGRLSRETRSRWLQTGLALTVLLTVGGLPFSLWLNRNIDPTSYPPGFLLVLASVKAGIVEELLNRFFLVSLLVWLGSRFSQGPDGRPTHRVYWGAILLAGLLFGWSHVDAQLDIPEAPFGALAGIMLLSTLLGTGFGWLFWKLGIEWAILAHFTYDAAVSAGLLKVYLLANVLVWAGFLIVLVLSVWMAWWTIRTRSPTSGLR